MTEEEIEANVAALFLEAESILGQNHAQFHSFAAAGAEAHEGR